MGDFFTALLAKLGAMLAWVGELFKGVFVSLWDVIKDAFCWAFESFLQLIQGILNALPGPDAFSAFNPAAYINGLPADLVSMIGYIRVGEALAIILAAILIKLTLQIIPFTRLGA